MSLREQVRSSGTHESSKVFPSPRADLADYTGTVKGIYFFGVSVSHALISTVRWAVVSGCKVVQGESQCLVQKHWPNRDWKRLQPTRRTVALQNTHPEMCLTVTARLVYTELRTQLHVHLGKLPSLSEIIKIIKSFCGFL